MRIKQEKNLERPSILEVTMNFQELSGVISSVIELGEAAIGLKDIPAQQRKHFPCLIPLILIIRSLWGSDQSMTL